MEVKENLCTLVRKYVMKHTDLWFTLRVLALILRKEVVQILLVKHHFYCH